MVQIDLQPISKTVSCIKVLKLMLDEAYDRIPGAEEVKDEKIRKWLAARVEDYKDLRSGKDINYAPSVARFAYIYKYVASHASLVAHAIDRTPELDALFDRDRVAFASLGGGPGTEYLGIFKYLSEKGKSPKVKASVFDREHAWGDSWFDIDDQIETDLDIRRQFLPIDVCEPKTWKGYDKYFESDLFTMVYFMSEVFKHKESAEPFFKHLLARAKPGAFVLYMDNSSGGFTEWFDELAAEADFERIKSATKVSVKLCPFTEEKSDFGEYFEKFGNPKIQAHISWRVVKKK